MVPFGQPGNGLRPRFTVTRDRAALEDTVIYVLARRWPTVPHVLLTSTFVTVHVPLTTFPFTSIGTHVAATGGVGAVQVVGNNQPPIRTMTFATFAPG